MDQLNHWRYFLSLEREVCDCLRYVELVDAHRNVYSFEFSRLLILICSELDVVFKVACHSVSSASNADSIGAYFNVLDKKYNLGSEVVRIDRFGETHRPFKDWNEINPPDWWTAHNKVKHHRHEHFDRATLHNTLRAICGLFIANLVVLHEFSLIGSIHDSPVMLGRDHEPGHLLLQSGYRVHLRGE